MPEVGASFCHCCFQSCLRCSPRQCIYTRFKGDFLLFLVPSLLILIAAGFDIIQRKTWKTFPLLSPLLLGFLLFSPLAEAARHLVKPRGLEEIRPVVNYVSQHMVIGDTLYYYYGAEPALEYYRERGLITPVKQVAGGKWIGNLQLYRLDLDKLRGQKRVWVLFSHISHATGVDEEILFIDQLDQIGNRLDSIHSTGASAYLYDLSSERNLSFIPEFKESYSGEHSPGKDRAGGVRHPRGRPERLVDAARAAVNQINLGGRPAILQIGSQI